MKAVPAGLAIFSLATSLFAGDVAVEHFTGKGLADRTGDALSGLFVTRTAYGELTHGISLDNFSVSDDGCKVSAMGMTSQMKSAGGCKPAWE